MSEVVEILSPDISVVIPCRNEEDNARGIAAAVIAQLENLNLTFDLIFIDNESTDRTVPIIRELCASDPRIRLIINSRNFGQIRSPTYAIFQARGRAIIAICADFQDPPELLPQFIERWQAGVEIVLGVRESEKTSPLLGWIREFSYTLGNRFGDFPLIRNATGFGLYDAKVVRAIKAMKEPEPFFRAMLVETGYALETIPYVRPERAGGLTNNNFFTLLDFALSGLVSTSKRLLRVPYFVGMAVGVLGLLSLLGALLALLTGHSASGWLIASAAEVQFALVFAFLGLIGDHIRIISERTRETPLVIERERVNFPEGY
jgi:glycosyltransferase involved in cell wall biosynthesis